MEVDMSKQILDWSGMQLAKIKALEKELAREGPIFFEVSPSP